MPQASVDAARLQLALRKLTVVGSVLYVGAHPDDENAGVLAALSLGRGLRTAYLSLTRGAGGQNLIGAEQGELLGVIRTHELLAARHLDGAEQFFTRAVDFGYSKDPDEALRLWGHQKVLADVVRIIRNFRPDVVITRFPSGGGGHGHHTASAILAEEAFTAAGDPNRFTDQLRLVRPWRPLRLVWNQWGAPDQDAEYVSLDVGAYDPLLGLSYSELSGLSRSMHKSQGMGTISDRRPRIERFRHVKGEQARHDLLDGIDVSWRRFPNAEAVGAMLEEAYHAFKPEQPTRSIGALLRAYSLLDELPENPWFEAKKQEIADAVRHCAGLWLEAIADKPAMHAGGTVSVSMSATNRSDYSLILSDARVGFKEQPVRLSASGTKLETNTPVTLKADVLVPRDAYESQPYWLTSRETETTMTYAAPDQCLVGLAEAPSDLRARFAITADGVTLVFSEPVLYRYVDRVRGERYRRFEILPEVSLQLETPVVLAAPGVSKKVAVQVVSRASTVDGIMHLRLPHGWQSEPTQAHLRLNHVGEASTIVFAIQAREGAANGAYGAEIDVGGRRAASTVVELDYEHLSPRSVLLPAQGRLLNLDLKIPSLHVGYVAGSGDAVPQALSQLGCAVAFLSDEDLLNVDLSKFDAIVTGIRAYNVREILAVAQPRLMEYVRGGGTLLVQYNTDRDLKANDLGPYPFHLSRKRVSVEDAPVSITTPDHPLINAPIAVGRQDFENWIQERGLYFPDQWDPHYATVIASSDPGEAPLAGGLLYARYGAGVYIYTSYAWFRQLPAGVPGAYRILANLIAAGSEHGATQR